VCSNLLQTQKQERGEGERERKERGDILKFIIP
jgi:hypothetical protein